MSNEQKNSYRGDYYAAADDSVGESVFQIGGTGESVSQRGGVIDPRELGMYEQYAEEDPLDIYLLGEESQQSRGIWTIAEYSALGIGIYSAARGLSRLLRGDVKIGLRSVLIGTALVAAGSIPGILSKISKQMPDDLNSSE